MGEHLGARAGNGATNIHHAGTVAGVGHGVSIAARECEGSGGGVQVDAGRAERTAGTGTDAYIISGNATHAKVAAGTDGDGAAHGVRPGQDEPGVGVHAARRVNDIEIATAGDDSLQLQRAGQAGTVEIVEGRSRAGVEDDVVGPEPAALLLTEGTAIHVNGASAPCMSAVAQAFNNAVGDRPVAGVGVVAITSHECRRSRVAGQHADDAAAGDFDVAGAGEALVLGVRVGEKLERAPRSNIPSLVRTDGDVASDVRRVQQSEILRSGRHVDAAAAQRQHIARRVGDNHRAAGVCNLDAAPRDASAQCNRIRRRDLAVPYNRIRCSGGGQDTAEPACRGVER